MFLKYQLLTDKQGHHGFAPMIMTDNAACADLVMPHDIAIPPHSYITVPLLIVFDIPVDWCLYLQPRSSTFTKHGLLSTTGIIDSDYKGTVHAQLFNMNNFEKTIGGGTRLVQIQLLQKQRLQLEQSNGIILQMTERNSVIGSTGL